MECFPDVPSALGSRPVWLTFLESPADWRRLLGDEDWDRLIERERRPFGLFTASPDPQADRAAWSEFAGYCVERELVLTASWGANSTVLDDVFDFAAVECAVDGRAGSEPLTSWHDDEPLDEALEFFLGSPGVDLRRDDHLGTDWVRVAIVVRDGSWCDELRTALARGY